MSSGQTNDYAEIKPVVKEKSRYLGGNVGCDVSEAPADVY